ncbi:helix-turn-helix domain-containing protein [Marinobacter sp. THAF197a]|uniref:helix-turn-helix domain-containing protein n=1 Tax=Marinobacter sp. THAF197a TaxID=2587869 RepID=UPI001267C9B8|nr:XRE family transcriptional regulator [Marinobacter sp. THAF197a]QFS86013.1 hypothetical protein FIV08_04105 [Marinobacter sp. THAF197a]
MIKERVITVIKESGLKNPELEERTGVNRYTWQNIRNKPERALKTEEIEAVIALFPHYGYWIATGNIAPEIGQTSPEYDEVNSKLDNRAEG